MSRATTPKYQRQRRDGKPDLAYVRIEGRKVYLGEFDTEDSRRAYLRTLQEWRAGTGLAIGRDDFTVAELCSAFRKHAEAYYL